MHVFYSNSFTNKFLFIENNNFKKNKTQLINFHL